MMSNQIRKLIRGILFLVVPAFLLSACFTPVSAPKDETETLPGGTLRVAIGAIKTDNRSLRPDFYSQGVSTYEIILEGPNAEYLTNVIVVPDLYASFTELAAGVWTATVNAYNPESTLLFSGTSSVALEDGIGTSLEVPLTPFRTSGNSGTFQLALSLSNLPGLQDPNSVSATLTALDGPDLTQGETVQLSVYDVTGTVVTFLDSLPSGDYKIDLLYDDGIASTPIPVDSVVKIYDNLVTDVAWDWDLSANKITETLSVQFVDLSGSFATGTPVLVSLDTDESLSLYGGLNPVALGMGLMAADGTATVDLYLPGSTERYTDTLDQAYYATILVDVNLNYESMGGTPADAVGILPHYGDYFSDNLPLYLDGSGTYQYFDSDTQLSTSYVYIATDTGAGLFDGQTRDNAGTLAGAVSYVNGLSLADGEEAVIYLDGDVTLSSGLTFQSSAILMPLGAGTSTIAAEYIDGNPFMIGDGGYAPEVSLQRINVNGLSPTTATAYSAFAIQWESTLTLTDSQIYGFNTTAYGGAVQLTSSYGAFFMENSSIHDCTAVYGGAIYTGTEMTADVHIGAGSSIYANNANSGGLGYGGGAYIGMGGYLILEGSANPPSISGNLALVDGGGVYIQSGGYLVDEENIADTVITGNFLSDATTPSDLVYTMPGVTVYFGDGYPEFEFTYTQSGLKEELFKFSAPAGFDSYTWAVNGFAYANGVSSISFVPLTDLPAELWWEGGNVITLVVTLDGVPYSVRENFYIGEYVGE